MRTVTRSKVHLGSNTPAPKGDLPGRGAANRMHRLYAAEDIVRCHRCPQGTFCDTCGGLNRARITMGMVRPRYQEDHKNNILYAIPIQKKGKIRSVSPTVPGAVVTACIVQLGGGWRRGVASLDGNAVYEGPPTRSMADAWAYANDHKEAIKDGLRFERMLESA